MLTRKHFQAIADCIKQVQETRRDDHAVAFQIALNLCVILKDANPAFDRQRFLTACGFPDA